MAADMFRLDDRTALVTGCKSGMGRSMAVALAEAGADIVGVSSTLTRESGEVAAAVAAAGRRFRAYDCDFADRRGVHALVRRLADDGVHVDVLVNNAGTIVRAPAVDQSDDVWDRVLEIDLSAQFVLARELGRRMLRAGRGKIVFVASMLSFQGGINVASYAASKGAIAQLTKALANEWASRGVNVNAIAPGFVSTELTQPLREDARRDAEIRGRIPAGRWGEPDDVRGAVVFLASPASDYVHGTILPVDGGWLAR